MLKCVAMKKISTDARVTFYVSKEMNIDSGKNIPSHLYELPSYYVNVTGWRVTWVVDGISPYRIGDTQEM